ncbi:hypothetical protein [Microbacterium sp.]|jgi:hypothetical protein|uniref:hypothetical protein n=1 Tax=Microbacterium sp. TaxID=51671 RepID=UPI0035B2BE30
MPAEVLLVTVLLPVAVGTALVLVIVARRRTPVSGSLTRLESWIVSLVGAGGMLAVALGTLGLVTHAVVTFTYEPSIVRDIGYTGSPVDRLVGVENVVDSGYQTAWVEVAGLPASARWLFYLESALPALTSIAIGVAVAWLAMTLLRDRPFTRALPHVIGVAAVAVLIGGVGGQIAGAFGRTATVEYLGPRDVTAGDDGSGPYPGLSLFTMNLDFAPVGWALGLALVAAAFQIGTRMQKDTEALV